MDKRLAWREARRAELELARFRAKAIRVGATVLAVPAAFYAIQYLNYLFRTTVEALLR